MAIFNSKLLNYQRVNNFITPKRNHGVVRNFHIIDHNWDLFFDPFRWCFLFERGTGLIWVMR